MRGRCPTVEIAGSCLGQGDGCKGSEVLDQALQQRNVAPPRPLDSTPGLYSKGREEAGMPLNNSIEILQAGLAGLQG